MNKRQRIDSVHHQPTQRKRAFTYVSVVLGLSLLVGCATQSFDSQGHRGARGLAPENTVAAFEKALAIGVTTLELDIGLTKDNVVVVYHDRTLNPDITRDSSGAFLAQRGAPISSLSFSELQRLDVGRIKPESNYARTFATQVPRDGERIPSLRSVFELVAKRNASVRLNIETKLSPLAPEETATPEAMVAALVDEIRKAGLQKRATIQSFDWRTLKISQTSAPEIATVYLTNQQGANDTVQIGKAGASPWLAGFDIDDYSASIPKLVKAAGGAVWSPNFRDLSEALVREAQALGLKVIPWTVNDVPDMKRLIDWKVDGIITDYPDRLRQVMKDAGMALPKP
jgi:glycerophosphoryl diester phosphodiesterase